MKVEVNETLLKEFGHIYNMWNDNHEITRTLDASALANMAIAKAVMIMRERNDKDEERKITTDKFGDHDRHEKFYEYNYNAEKENELAEKFCQIRDGVYDLYEFKRKGLDRISDEDLPEVAEHMEAITEILEKYRKE